MAVYETGIIEQTLDQCEDLEDLKQKLIPKLQDQRLMWQGKIRQILEETGCSCRQFALRCGVSEPTVRKWRNGSLPQSRDMYIRIGFAAGFTLEEMNAFLMRYGRCPQLYVRSLEDSVYIFVLRSETLPHTYETCRELLELVQQEMSGREGQPVQRFSTGQLSQSLSGVTSREEMIEFARRHADAYREGYGRLYNFILAFLRVNLMDFSGGSASFHSMATESNWSSSLRHCITEIRNRRWFPLRHKLISLGLHLNMDTEDINRMLAYAQMEPLYVKNPIEAVVKFAVNEAKLASEEDEIIQDGSDGLCRFVRSILAQLELSAGEYFIDDL